MHFLVYGQAPGWPYLLEVLEDGLWRVTTSSSYGSKVSLGSYVPTERRKQQLATLDHGPTRTGDSMPQEQSWETFWPGYLRLQRLFGGPGELSMLPGEERLKFSFVGASFLA